MRSTWFDTVIRFRRPGSLSSAMLTADKCRQRCVSGRVLDIDIHIRYGPTILSIAPPRRSAQMTPASGMPHRHDHSTNVAKRASTASAAERVATVAMLEQRIVATYEAINSRWFGMDSPIHQHLAPFWKARIQDRTDRVLTHDEFVMCLRDVTEAYPQFNKTIVGMTTDATQTVNVGRAVIFDSMEKSGMVPGIVERSMLASKWQRFDGVWLNTEHECVPGLDWGGEVNLARFA